MKKINLTSMKKLISLFILLTLTVFVNAQDIKNNPGSNHGNKFEQKKNVTKKKCENVKM